MKNDEILSFVIGIDEASKRPKRKCSWGSTNEIKNAWLFPVFLIFLCVPLILSISLIVAFN